VTKHGSMCGLLIALLPLAFAAAPARAATISFVQDFNTIDLDFTEYKPDGYTTSISFSDGSQRAVRYAYDKYSAIAAPMRLHAISQSFLYDPSIQGVIDSIDASMALSNYVYSDGTPLSLASLPNRLRLLAKQNGNVYEAVYDAPGAAGAYGVYSTAARTGFTANDFKLFDPANPNAARTLTGLDFAGSTIAFGFEIAPSNVVYSGSGLPFAGHSAAVSDVGAFSVSINYGVTSSPAPEPALWATMVVGFGSAGVMLRRKRRLQGFSAPA